MLPVVGRLAAESGVPVSIDTSKAAVAAAALDAGATVVNDVAAAADPEMFGVVAAAGAGLVVMHMQGEPRTMQADPHYGDVVVEVGDFLLDRLAAARAAGIHTASLCADPGLGFGKTAAHNVELLARLGELVARLDVPVLVGPSRKSFIARCSVTTSALTWSRATTARSPPRSGPSIKERKRATSPSLKQGPLRKTKDEYGQTRSLFPHGTGSYCVGCCGHLGCW